MGHVREGLGVSGVPGRRGGRARAGRWTAQDLPPAAGLPSSTRESHAKPPSSPWQDGEQSGELVPGAQAVGFRERAGNGVQGGGDGTSGLHPQSPSPLLTEQPCSPGRRPWSQTPVY